ncbi:hypothetical protein EDM00_11985 [Ornithobacterium rhinotracheale]|uniref:hypothetical protein n=1 Tax=Ornithobacterium rhinotracheale TaxID=28251 RepID=UPI00129C884C|nr:hypothetical protein [Ornithobacterium rhinotracheale]MRI64699.1 hypothetical protein [Ornithobacterium rhinotracheale]
MSKENINTIEISEEVKKALKNQHGDKLRVIALPTDDLYEKYKEVAVVVPSRSVVSQYMRFAKDNPLKAQEILVKNCVLTSKEEVMADDGLFYGCVGMLAELIPVREGKFVKL